MRAAFLIAAKDLRQRLRDRSVLVIAFLVPFGLAGILSLTLAGVEEEQFTATFGVVDLDGGQVSAGFVELLEGLDFVTLLELPSPERADALADAGEIDAAFVIPEGFSASAGSGQGGVIRVITDPEGSIGPLIATSLARSFASEIDAVQVAVATVLGADEHDPGTVAEVVARARETRPAAVVDPDTAESRLFSSTTFYAAGMAVFFVFFTVEFGVRSLLDERQSGTLARLLVAPMRPAWIIGGKALASFLVGLVSMSALVVASTALLGADWGNPVGVALLVVAGVLAAMGLTALVATLAKTPAQASGYASTAAVVLGFLGGTFFPISQGPSFLVNVSLVAPQAWMVRGFQNLAGALERTEGIEVRAFDDREALTDAVERGLVEAGLVIPPGYDRDVRSGERVRLGYLARPVGAAQEARLVVAAAVDRQSVVLRAARFAEAEGAGTFDEALERARALSSVVPRARVETAAAGGEDAVGLFDYGAAQETILFVFVISLAASGMLIESRPLGTSRRMLASPTPARTVMTGEAAGRLAIAPFQGLLIVVVTAVLFGVDWGDPVATAAVLVSFALVGTGAAMLMGSVLSSAQQAGSLGIFFGLVLAALGGCMVPLEVFPPAMRTVAHVTPHAWAMDAFGDILGRAGGVGDVAIELGVLLAYAAALLGVAVALFRRRLTASPAST